MPNIYALNRNYAAYTIEQASDTVDFNIWDEGTVRRLLRDNPATMPYYPPNRAVERGIDLAWGKQKITDTVRSGILQGLSIPQITKYLQGTITSMNKSSATRAARTAVTSAENGGRMDTFNAASSMGIKMEKEWMATRDYRTRESHAHLDSVHVPNNKKFPNGLRYPGDPEGRAAEVYNCRCTLVSWFPELNEKRTNNTVASYKKWEKTKESEYAFIKNSLNDSSANNIIFMTKYDPMVEVTGAAEISNPKEVQSFLEEIEEYKKLGLIFVRKHDENLGYIPSNTTGIPGTLYISYGASYSAWCHEMQHVRDARDGGWLSAKDIFESSFDIEYQFEKRAYAVEIELAKKENRPDIVRRLRKLRDAVRKRTGV